MFRATCFENDLHTRFAYVEIDALAHVFHLDEVRTCSREQCEQLRQTARSVGDAREQQQATSGLCFVTAHEPRHQSEIDIAAGEYNARGPIGRWFDETAHQRGCTNRTGSFDQQFATLHQENHCVGDVVFFHNDDVVEEVLDDGSSHCTRFLHRDSIGECDNRPLGCGRVCVTCTTACAPKKPMCAGSWLLCAFMG